MYRLSSIILLVFGFLPILAQSPHGDNLKFDCAMCHDPSGWSVENKTIEFDHSTTNFELEGTHAQTDCKTCHTTLVFEDASTQCIACHEDVHSMSVGDDCAMCHNTKNWLVSNIHEIHEENGFPLIGVHGTLSCDDCHISETGLRFDRIGNECISCHREDYQNTQSPNHVTSGYSTNCIECHDILGRGWNSENIVHDFFPLTKGHDIQNCKECHVTNNFSDASPECVSCHLDNFNQSVNPNHKALGFSTECTSCHTTDPGWEPARFDNHNDYYPLNGAHAAISNDCAICHDGNYNNTPNTCVGCHLDDYNKTTNPSHVQAQFSTDCKECHGEVTWEPATFDHDAQYFPIYSGKHRGEWDKCTDCHTNPDNYAVFTCTNCHTNPETDNNHNGVPGYTFESNACLSCHPTGSNEGFDHNTTNFPLTGRHIGVDCKSCHSNGYQGTPTDCNSCHNSDYNSTTEPNHAASQFPTDCKLCHTESGWEPSTFDHNSTDFPLKGRHTGVDCKSCHSNGYRGTPTDCNSCHNSDYKSTTDPNHASAGFSTDCKLCHSESGWKPADFDHDAQYFPIYSGKHRNEWDQCSDCHSNSANYADFTCLTCHKQSSTNGHHDGVSGYQYVSSKCLECHPDGSE